MRKMQLIEMNGISPPDTELCVPYELVLTDPDGDNNVTIQIKKVEEKMQIAPESILACLQKCFDEIDRDAAVSPNTVCRKGCCGCCSNDFEISISEYFMILRFMNIKYGEEYVQSISEKAKMSFHADRCIFVNCTDGSCSIYEVRPPQKSFACRTKRIVHWFADLQNGKPAGEKMRELFYNVKCKSKCNTKHKSDAIKNAQDV